MENVKTGKEKQAVYAKEYKLFKKALKEEFYLEAVAIGYAVMEDRLVSFFEHAGILSQNNEDIKIARAAYPYVRRLLGKEDDYSVKIKNISVKINLICKLLLLTEETAKDIDALVDEYINQGKQRHKRIARPGYMTDLYLQINNTLDKELILDVFYELDLWRTQRNQLIHALMSKTVSTAEIIKKECAINGYKITRDLDNCLIKPFKEKNSIREKYNIL